MILTPWETGWRHIRRGAVEEEGRRRSTRRRSWPEPCSLHSVGVRPEDSIRVGRITRVLNEFVRPRRRGPSVALDVAAYHVHGEPVPAAEALRRRVPAVSRRRDVGTAVGHHLVPSPRQHPAGVGRTTGGPGLQHRERRFDRVRRREPSCGETVSRSRACLPTTVNTCSPRARVPDESIELFVEAAANPPSPFGANPWPLLLPEPQGAALVHSPIRRPPRPRPRFRSLLARLPGPRRPADRAPRNRTTVRPPLRRSGTGLQPPRTPRHLRELAPGAAGPERAAG